MPKNYSIFTKSLFSTIPALLCLYFISQVVTECHIKITYTGSCILVGSCQDVDGIKYLQPIKAYPIDEVNCNYQKLSFFFNDSPCTVKIERIGQTALAVQDDSLVQSYNSIENPETEQNSEELSIGDTDRAVITDCGLETQLHQFNSLSFEHSALRVNFTLNPNRYFII